MSPSTLKFRRTVHIMVMSNTTTSLWAY